MKYQQFKRNEKVLCVNAELALGGIKEGNHYLIEKQSFAGYVWLQGILQPYLPSRFKGALTRMDEF